MRKNVFGRQFKRDSGERKALFKGLASSLVIHERIQTTEEKAKSVKGQVEKLVTKAKKGDLHSERMIQPFLNKEATVKMMQEIAPRFKTRPGGYTRIIRLGKRLQDNASMVILEWVEKRPAVVASSTKKAPKTAIPAKTTSETKEATAKVEKPKTVKKAKTVKKDAKEKKK